jgi:hypothetical protein
MQHKIDLGNELVIDVAYAGQEYKLREPTVGELDQFRAANIEVDGVSPIVELLTRLGMPKEVILKMGMSKARQLVDGLMDVLTKKK